MLKMCFDASFQLSSALRKFVFLVFIGGVVLFGLTGCESMAFLNFWDDKAPKSDIGREERAEVLFNDGLARLDAKDYQGASKKFIDLDKQYPYSSWSKRALLLATFASYEGVAYPEAIEHGKRYIQLFPASSDTAYVQYLIGMSYFKQILDISRDQDRAEKTVVNMEELLHKWPNSEYVNDAREKIRIAKDQLAGKEMEVGRYYLQKRNYAGAINRFREVLIRYQTTRHVEEALSRLTEAYLGLGIVNEAQTAAAVLGHNFPDSQWYKDAYNLLKSRGSEPREYDKSWISQTFRGFTRVVGL